MASKHRKRSRTLKRAAAMGVATATVTALVAGGAPMPVANAAAPQTVVDPATQTAAIELASLLSQLLVSNQAAPTALAATPGSPGLPPMELAPGAPDPDSIPDLTFGFGGQVYDSFQSLGAALETELLNNINLAGILGIDQESIDEAIGTALTQLLEGVTINLGSIGTVAGLPLGAILNAAGINNAAALLELLGFDLSDPFAALGINVITAGPPFSLLKFLGIDFGWVPGFPNSVADEINGTDYLDVSTLGLLTALNSRVPDSNFSLKTALALAIAAASLPGANIDIVDVRVPVVVGFGLGAFAAGMAYPQVVADLPNQPGGANNVGSDPLLGSITILPMILLRNPGRANGGLFARFYPLAGLFGIDTITPDTEVTNSNDNVGLVNIPIGNTGIVLGAANLIPIKVDATVEYDPLSDFGAWPNPFTLANSAAAGLFPTYILRGVNAASLTEVVTNQLTPQLLAALGNTQTPLALNFYLTVPVNNALPLLEPVKLPIDFINLVTGANLNNPIATAFEPALTTLVNLGYTDVKRTVGPDGVPVYDRTLDQANVITPYGSLPQNIDWGQVPEDLVIQLVAGIQKAIDDGLVSSTPVNNPLSAIGSLLGGLTGASSPLSGLDVLSQNAIDQAAEGALDGVQAKTTGTTPPPSDNKAPETVNTLADNATDTVTVDEDTDADDAKPARPFKLSAEAEKRAKARAEAAEQRRENFEKAAKKGQQQINKVFKDVADGVQKTVNAISGKDKDEKKADEKSSDDKE